MGHGYEVDFHWPVLGLVVKTDGLRYHRTPAEQASDRCRDHAHTAVGLAQLRFTHGQVKYEKEHVRRCCGPPPRGCRGDPPRSRPRHAGSPAGRNA